MKRRLSGLGGHARSRGFSLIEVLIALLVLAFGLLGFALLQTMNVRFVQSANYRTQATNLSYELLDQIRINRIAAASSRAHLNALSTSGSFKPRRSRRRICMPIV